MTVPMKQPAQADIMERVLLQGDLAKLTPDERVKYYSEVCRSLGLNPLTQPFAYITLNGKLQLYALRACADQLRKVNGVSLEIVSREISDGILTVHVRAKLPDGRADEDLGSVSFPDTLKGEARANAELKAATQAAAPRNAFDLRTRLARRNRGCRHSCSSQAPRTAGAERNAAAA